MPEQQPQNTHKVTIIINGRPHEYGAHEISYEQLVNIAYPSDKPQPDVTYTVTYSNPHGRDGTLVAGQSVSVQEGMNFHVAKTHRS